MAEIHARRLETQWSSGSLNPLSHTKQKMDTKHPVLSDFLFFLQGELFRAHASNYLVLQIVIINDAEECRAPSNLRHSRGTSGVEEEKAVSFRHRTATVQ